MVLFNFIYNDIQLKAPRLIKKKKKKKRGKERTFETQTIIES